jgi:hypothetical protein
MPAIIDHTREDIRESLNSERLVVETFVDGSFREVDMDAPQVWVPFMNWDQEYETDDIQVEDDGFDGTWELVDYPYAPFNPRMSMYGPVSVIVGLNDVMTDYVRANPGVYALVDVEGQMPDHLGGDTYNGTVGDVLVRYSKKES